MKKRIKKHHILIILSCVLVYLAIILFYNLGVQSFWIDEGYSTYTSKDMVLNWFYKNRYFLFNWLQALFLKYGWFTDFWARFSSVITQIISIILMYLIPVKLTKNKYVGLISAIVFWFLYWEIAWWREARFYSLLQCLFLWWIASLTYRVENKKVMYLNLAILLAGLGILFHPFMYCLCAVILFSVIQQYKKAWDFKTLFSKKYLSFWCLVVLWLVGLIVYCMKYWMLGKSLTGSILWDKPLYFIPHYFIAYVQHIWGELWILSILWVLWMIWLLIKKKWKESVLFFFPFLLFVYALNVKWYLIHFRYALLILPLLIVVASIFSYDIFKLIKNKTIKGVCVFIVLIGVLITTRFQFLPKTYYSLDFTSPQPNFKAAYASIPDWENVISWFPTLCEWYYWDRGNCVRAIRVDLIHDWDVEELVNAEEESYTKIPYMKTLDDLDDWIYYFVIDNLTTKSNEINNKLYKQLKEYWTTRYESWKSYNNILVSILGVEE